MATKTEGLPHLVVLNRFLELPMVEMALSKSASTYSRVKDCHQLVHWALSTAEASLTNAKNQAVPLAVPIAKKLETSIQYVDHTLCLGLDKIEKKVPIVKEKPEKILENAYTLAMQTVRPAVSTITYANDLIVAQAASLKALSWSKVNQMLDSHYGSIALHSLDSTAAVAEKLIDQYFPAIGEENDIVPVSADEDKLLHTVQILGRLSNKAARRVYAHVVLHLKIIKKDDLKEYISSLVTFLQLTEYLQAVNEKVQTFTSNSKKTANNHT